MFVLFCCTLISPVEWGDVIFSWGTFWLKHCLQIVNPELMGLMGSHLSFYQILMNHVVRAEWNANFYKHSFRVGTLLPTPYGYGWERSNMGAIGQREKSNQPASNTFPYIWWSFNWNWSLEGLTSKYVND